MRSPRTARRLRRVVVGIVIGGQRDIEALGHVAIVLGLQRAAIIFGMPEHEEVATVNALRDIDARLVGNGDQLKLRMRLDVLGVNLGVARVRRHERVVEAAHERGEGLHHIMAEHAEHLLRQLVLRHTVMEVDASLRTPANMEGRVHVRGRPLHDLAQLVPIVYVLEVKQLNRRAGDDHAVKMTVLDLIKRGVEGLQMLSRNVLRLVRRRFQQLNLDLQRSVGQLAQNLGLGDDFRGHEVHQQQLQGTNVLMHCAVFGHNEDVLALERRSCGQGVGDSNGHAHSFRT